MSIKAVRVSIKVARASIKVARASIKVVQVLVKVVRASIKVVRVSIKAIRVSVKAVQASTNLTRVSIKVNIHMIFHGLDSLDNSKVTSSRFHIFTASALQLKLLRFCYRCKQKNILQTS